MSLVQVKMWALQVFLEIAGIVFVSVWPEERNKCETYFIFLYLHCTYWLVIMIADHVIKAKHHNLRICGYLDFYQSTYQHIRTPLFVASLWNTCYLLLAVILHHTHKYNYEDYCRSSEWFTPVNYILMLTTFELMIIVPVYINYISKSIIAIGMDYLLKVFLEMKKQKHVNWDSHIVSSSILQSTLRKYIA